ncbi:MAG: germination protein YpeB [Peptococcaceae bacterium]|nr:germination protein YpeB [Peptococcaceae bacterium]
MSKRLILPAFVGLLVVAAVWAWGLEQSRARASLQNMLNAQYQNAFYSTLTRINNLDALLGKETVASGEQRAILLADIWQEAIQAQASLTQLPVRDVVLSQTAKFLAQVGDYAHSLMHDLARGKQISAQEQDKLREMRRQMATLNKELQEMEREINKNGAGYWEIADQFRSRPAARKPHTPAPGEETFNAINREIEQMPTLIYDGPFSDHLERQKPLALKGKKMISEAEARSRALKLIDGQDGVNYQARVTGSTLGRLPSYRVVIKGRGQGPDKSITVDISKHGGEPVWMLLARSVGSPKLNVDEGRARAKAYLAKIGKPNMVATYWERNDNTVTYNFAGKENGVIIYPDLIKVTVALDNGQVVGMEAAGYLMQHHERDIAQPRLSEAEARKQVAPALNPGNGRLAIIPTDGGGEVLTYEFRGRSDGAEYLVYINANDGNTEKILQLQDTKNGTLVM